MAQFASKVRWQCPVRLDRSLHPFRFRTPPESAIWAV